MLTIEEALELVARHVEALAPRRVPLDEAAGLVLAEDVFSDIDSPPFTKSLMDGYAVISSDREIVRRVLEEVAAGAVPTCAVVLGTATQIMTGAPVPVGADAVVPGVAAQAPLPACPGLRGRPCRPYVPLAD